MEKQYEPLTPSHWDLMEKAEKGFHWDWNQDPDVDAKLLYLRDIGYITAREDIAPGFLCLTESGKIALYHHRQDQKMEKKERREKIVNRVIAWLTLLISALVLLVSILDLLRP